MMVLDALENIVTRSDSERIGGIENSGDRTSGGGCNTILQRPNFVDPWIERSKLCT